LEAGRAGDRHPGPRLRGGRAERLTHDRSRFISLDQESTMTTPTLNFSGTDAAELFSRECRESLDGLCTWNLVREPGELPAGFVHASPPGQGWAFTMWTRDAGVFLRELVLWGRFDEARLVANCLMDLVARNEQGFHAFPERFNHGKPGCGHEIDGTCAIVIALAILEARLPVADALAGRIRGFLLDEASPVAFLAKTAADRPLIAGGGEFGAGCGLPGLACNAVQNHLAVLALSAGAGHADRLGRGDLAGAWRAAARRLRDGLDRHLVDERQTWIWAVNPDTLVPDPAVIEAPVNRGFGGINGILSMWADVFGLEPLLDPWPGIGRSRRTLARLRTWPQRREAFERYGIWTQFDVYDEKNGPPGSLSSPSYGHGYATQCFQLLDEEQDYTRAIEGLAHMAFDKGQRRSPYLFHERMYCPPLPDAARKGCAELNLVCAAEPLKIARLILGIDDRPGEPVHLVPRLPAGWTRCQASNWPILLPDGLARVDITVERIAGNLRLRLAVAEGRHIPALHLRLNGCRQQIADAGQVDLSGVGGGDET
jgi:hypothetical protein